MKKCPKILLLIFLLIIAIESSDTLKVDGDEENNSPPKEKEIVDSYQNFCHSKLNTTTRDIIDVLDINQFNTIKTLLGDKLNFENLACVLIKYHHHFHACMSYKKGYPNEFKDVIEALKKTKLENQRSPDVVDDMCYGALHIVQKVISLYVAVIEDVCFKDHNFVCLTMNLSFLKTIVIDKDLSALASEMVVEHDHISEIMEKISTRFKKV